MASAPVPSTPQVISRPGAKRSTRTTSSTCHAASMAFASSSAVDALVEARDADRGAVRARLHDERARRRRAAPARRAQRASPPLVASSAGATGSPARGEEDFATRLFIASALARTPEPTYGRSSTSSRPWSAAVLADGAVRDGEHDVVAARAQRVGEEARRARGARRDARPSSSARATLVAEARLTSASDDGPPWTTATAYERALTRSVAFGAVLREVDELDAELLRHVEDLLVAVELAEDDPHDAARWR